MKSTDRIEFYNDAKPQDRDLVATAASSMVPREGDYISIRQKTWVVVATTYALDDADDPAQTRMRANVTLQAV